jgi:Flp pilus assembly protein CpaB
LKRSNRLFLLLGIVLAVVAAAGIILITSTPTRGPTATPAAQVDVVTAAVELPLGEVIAEEHLGTTTVPVTDVPLNAVTNAQELLGLTVRRPVSQGEIITRDVITTGGRETDVEAIQRALDAGFRAMAVQVDQVTGVGTLIRAGDRVDVVITFSDSAGKNPVLVDAQEGEGTLPADFLPVDGLLNNTTTKILVENVKVLGTLLPPLPAQQGQQAPQPTAGAPQEGEPGTALTGQQQIAILGLLPQQVELVRFAQIDGEMSLVLRATEDNLTPPIQTTGITLSELYDTYGILPPNINVIEIP